MKPFNQLILGILAAIGTGVLVLSAISLSLTEGQSLTSVVVSPTSIQLSVTPVEGNTAVIPLKPSATLTQSLSTLCPPPEGWRSYVVQPGDALSELATRSGLHVAQLRAANCLLSTQLLSGTIIFLPPSAPTNTVPPAPPTTEPLPTSAVTLPTAQAQPTARPTNTSIPCGPPSGWVLYTVQPNDTLYRLSQAYGISVYQLQRANCLSGTLIQAGTRIYVPYVIIRTPVPTFTQAATQTPSSTSAPVETNTPSVTATNAGTFTPTDTNVPTQPTPTIAEVPTDTPVPTFTNTPEPSTATNTAVPVVPTPTTASPPSPTPVVQVTTPTVSGTMSGNLSNNVNANH